MDEYYVILGATLEDDFRGKRLVQEVEGAVYNGVQSGIKTENVMIPPHFIFTLDAGKGTTVALPLNTNKEALERVKREKAGLE